MYFNDKFKSEYKVDDTLPSGITLFRKENGLDRQMVASDGLVLCHCEGTSIAIRNCLHVSDAIPTESIHGKAVVMCLRFGENYLRMKK
mgnify:CR=1 FL=1